MRMTFINRTAPPLDLRWPCVDCWTLKKTWGWTQRWPSSSSWGETLKNLLNCSFNIWSVPVFLVLMFYSHRLSPVVGVGVSGLCPEDSPSPSRWLSVVELCFWWTLKTQLNMITIDTRQQVTPAGPKTRSKDQVHLCSLCISLCWFWPHLWTSSMFTDHICLFCVNWTSQIELSL